MSTLMDNENLDPLKEASSMTSQHMMPPKVSRQPFGVINNIVMNRQARNISKNLPQKRKVSIEPNAEVMEEDEFDEDLNSVINKCETINMSDATTESNVLHSKYKIFKDHYFAGPEDSIDLYYKDVMPYMLSQEKQFLPYFNYYERQTEVTYEMRLVLADWLVEVAQDFKFNSETFFLAISYVEIFLSNLNINKQKFQLLGITALFIAAKVEEIYTPDLIEYINVTADTYTKEEMLRMERVILKALKFNVFLPTPLYFLRAYLSQMKVPTIFEHLSHYFCELTVVLGGSFLKYRPSQIAASCLILANFTFRTERVIVAPLELTPYHFSDVVECFEDLHRVATDANNQNAAAIKAKYSTSQYSKAALVIVPSTKNLMQI